MRPILYLNSRPRLVGAAVVVAAMLYVAAGLFDGWIPHDEGQLGQSAERVLAGELPHRDFDDMYTGALTFVNAASFRWLGVDCRSPRIVLAALLAPTLAAYFYLATRPLPPLLAALSTLLAAALSLPTYSAAMPSWYNLFLAILGAAALVRHVETGRRRWLFFAGLCGGVSILFKITGLFFTAAGLLFLAYREQELSTLSRSAESLATDEAGRGNRGWYCWLASFALLAFALLGVGFVRSGRPEMNLIHFTVPMAALASLLLAREWQLPLAASSERLRRMAGMLAPFALGTAAPVAAFVGYYAARGALPHLYEGVFVLPRLRVAGAAYPLPPWESFLIAAPIAGLLAAGTAPTGRSQRLGQWLAIAAMALLLGISHTEVGFKLAFNSLRNLLPWLVAIAIWMLLFQSSRRLTSQQRQLLLIVAATAAMVGLIQYPHAYGIYFYYVAPLVVLLATTIVALQPSPLRHAIAGLGVFYLALAVLRLNGADPHSNADWLPYRRVMAPMAMERCDLLVPRIDAVSYRELVAEVQRHSQPGSYILAGPDCPEAYYLCNRRNPGPVMYEFFRPTWLADEDQLLKLLDERDVRTVVVNVQPQFSEKYSDALLAKIALRFPQQRAILWPGRPADSPLERFRVFWRD